MLEGCLDEADAGDLVIKKILLTSKVVKSDRNTIILFFPKAKSSMIHSVTLSPQGGNSQNFLCKFVRFFVTLSP